MKQALVIIFSLVLIFPTLTFAHRSAHQNIIIAASPSRYNVPNLFRPIKNLWRKIFKKKYQPDEVRGNVESIILDKTEVIANCPSESGVMVCDESSRLIAVEVIATYGSRRFPAETFGLTYNYTLSGGKILGKGKNVVWDLTGVAPGTYTITAGADDGCGVCGRTVTREIKVVECSECLKNDSALNAELNVELKAKEKALN